MAFTYDQIFAADPSDPGNVARNGGITIFAPGDPTQTPIEITTPDGTPLPNPVPVNENGFGEAFMHETLDRVAWAGGGFEGFFTSYEGLKNVAVEALAGVQGIAADAAASAAAAEAAAALVDAPADSAISTAINGTDTQTRAALDTFVDAELDSRDYATATELESQVSNRVVEVRTLEELQEAVAVGGTIRVGSAPIELTATVNVSKPCRIIGGRFTMPADASRYGFRISSGSVTLDGLDITGPGTAATLYNAAAPSTFVYALGTQAAPLRNVNVVNCTMRGSQADGVRLEWVSDSIVSENIVDDFLYAGVMLLSVDNVTVANNSVTNAVMKGSVVNVYGIAATDWPNTVAARSKNVRVIGNMVKNIPWEGIECHGAERFQVIGNTVVNCPRAIALVVGNATRLTSPIDCLVQGNIVDRAGATYNGNEREGISLYGLASNLADAHILGNTIRGYTAQPIVLSGYAPLKTLVQGNSHPHLPWTDLTVSSPWAANASFKPQYMVEGRMVYLRGMVQQTTGATGDSIVGTLPEVCRSDRNIVHYGTSHGAAITGGVATLSVGSPDGTINNLVIRSKTTTDTSSYPIDGSYSRAFAG
ncbi:right-handed parallel beta-helix repeat-containing protein [Arthrobacter zhaoguopingii]|uniref:right-handed parallel beta-helix repeat-containing protein n=1 Tax=Arthrobacter zhaoguopingii TaxID=2681491 RepID=UPI0013591E63|nr:right-handed parallel beta-helix repeat-containing protein [Arthrobacter zhaoguopingii]